MIRRIELTNFKNFSHAALDLGPLTVLVGANASGKSNVRDAFRFLHGISRRYGLSEIIGANFGESGIAEWTGIRGGLREIVLEGHQSFGISVEFDDAKLKNPAPSEYSIEIRIDGGQPRITRESFYFGGDRVFETVQALGPGFVSAVVQIRDDSGQVRVATEAFSDSSPIATQLLSERNKLFVFTWLSILSLHDEFRAIRFLDPEPPAMRNPSLPGQDILGNRGENLSSVLLAICQDERKKATLLEWVNELTPMDATDFEFPEDLSGKVLLRLVEESGRKTTANSASDGTLRFLAMIAALLGRHAASFYFLEELENGIHPTRLSLLLDLIERQVAKGKVQVVATTHSPQLLGFLSESALKDAALVYRLEGRPDAQIKRLIDIPDAPRLIKEQHASRLFASGWFDTAVEFLEGAEVES